MAVVRIRLHPDVFDAGKPFEDKTEYRQKVRLVIAGRHVESGFIVPGKQLNVTLDQPRQNHAMIVDVSGWQIANHEQFNALPLNEMRADIADLVDREIIVVEKGGAAQTVAAILTTI
mgnify:CR=1 FL=1